MIFNQSPVSSRNMLIDWILWTEDCGLKTNDFMKKAARGSFLYFIMSGLYSNEFLICFGIKKRIKL